MVLRKLRERGGRKTSKRIRQLVASLGLQPQALRILLDPNCHQSRLWQSMKNV